MSSRLYFINDVPNAVRHGLEGFVAVNSHLMLHKSSNIVVRRDFDDLHSKEEVALISGGGSGHEPSHAGFVGSGLLTASVSGNIFASPTAVEVLRAIKLVSKKGDPGTLLIVPNYTGDRLHFGSARERAVVDGYKVEIFVFGDDCVFGSDTGRTGPRGLAGVFFIHKIAGALAESGTPLKSIKSKIEAISSRIGSISISLGPCNVPGVGSSFVMPPGQLEIGLGIHGERGASRIPYVPVHEAVTLLLNQLTSPEVSLSKYFSSSESTRIVLLFNDNGGLTTIEMNSIIRETVSQLVSRGFTIERTYSGRYVTSFDMIGVCISMIVIDDEILALLDAPCFSAIVSQNRYMQRTLNDAHSQIVEEEEQSQFDSFYLDRLKKCQAIFVKCVAAACKTLIENETLLNKLDSESGDSDCGSTLASGARTIMETIETKSLEASFRQLSQIIEKCMGGTSGALFSLLFTGASTAILSLPCHEAGLDLKIEDWAKVVSCATENMTKYSHAQPGDRTLVDPLDCLADALKANSSSSSDIREILQNVAQKVENSAKSTEFMVAKIGRASYAPAATNEGPDPGAWAIHLIVKAVFETYSQSLR